MKKTLEELREVPRKERREGIYDFLLINFDNKNKEVEDRLHTYFPTVFNTDNFLPGRLREDYVLGYVSFTSLFVHLHEAFGRVFDESIERLLDGLKEYNEQIIKSADKNPKTIKVNGTVLYPTGVDPNYFLRKFYFNQEFVEEIKSHELQPVPLSIYYCVDDMREILSSVFLQIPSENSILEERDFSLEKIVFNYGLVAKSEYEKEVRLPNGWEQRTYNIVGKTHQLNEFEQLFSYLEMLGIDGHTSSVLIHYDGDGDARMSFRRADGIDLPFPEKHLVHVKRIGHEEEIISFEEYKRLAEEHQGFEWKEEVKSVLLETEYRDNIIDDSVESFVID